MSQELTTVPIEENQPLRMLMARAMDLWKQTYKRGEANRKDDISDLFVALKEHFEASACVKAHPDVVVDSSTGTGVRAAVPWVAFLHNKETKTVKHGVYVVLLFREDATGAYLTFNQGITEPDQPGRKWIHDKAVVLRRQCEKLDRNGFHLDDGIDLRSDTARAKLYCEATVAYKLYERSDLPTDGELLDDLSAVLSEYEAYVSGGEDDRSPELDAREVEAPDTESRQAVVLLHDGHTHQRIRVDPTRSGFYWPDCQAGGYICAGWDEIGDLQAFADRATFAAAFASQHAAQYVGRDNALTRDAAQLWTLRQLQPGDKVIASRGPAEVLAVGTVLPPGYEWRPDRGAARHTVRVKWETRYAKTIPWQRNWSSTTITEVPERLYRFIISNVLPKRDLNKVYDSFSAGLKQSGIWFGEQHEELVRSFIASLATKRFAILTGLSGSGKTQIALRFGDWLGEERCLLVPVRPDWTGAEALFGYVNALVPEEDGRRAWFVPEALAFMLKAAADPANPYLLILDEMNLAHVERYFADVLSGMESGKPCLPNLSQIKGTWRDDPGEPDRIPLPDNLFIIGTVNVDETTYMFSPKVLDRANTFEFRVKFRDLAAATQKPEPCAPGDPALMTGFLCVATDDGFMTDRPSTGPDQLPSQLETVHQILSEAGFEFGYRVYYEAQRFARMLRATAEVNESQILDRIVLQKLLPRLHGTRRELEETLCAVGRFCFELTYLPAEPRFDPEKPPADQRPRLPGAFDKVRRMTRRLRVNQFASFTE